MTTRQKSKRPLLELITLVTSLVLGLSVVTLNGHTTGTLTYDKGNLTYTGDIKNNRMTGKGKLTYANGDSYEGDFVNGVFNGKGTFISNQGWRYEGEFKKGQPDGQGKLTAKDKTVYQGKFKQGIYQK